MLIRVVMLYVWLYYDCLFVFDYICIVLCGSVLYISCGLSAVKINEELFNYFILLAQCWSQKLCSHRP